MDDLYAEPEQIDRTEVGTSAQLGFCKLKKACQIMGQAFCYLKCSVENLIKRHSLI